MTDYLDPDHWVNGGEHDFSDPIAKAFSELESENKRLRLALERIRDCDLPGAKGWLHMQQTAQEALE